MNFSPDWPSPSAQADVRELCLSILTDERTPARLKTYFDPQSAYAGDTFLQDWEQDPNRIGLADLYAVTTLNVRVAPDAARRILADGETSEFLRRVPTATSPADATPENWEATAALYVHLKTLIGKNPWVVASKLLARKRPWLVCVRDRLVTRELLGLARDFREDWQVYASLVSDVHIATALASLDAVLPTTDQSRPPLRVLDAALWMWTASD